MRGRETVENGVIYWIIVIKNEKWGLSFVWVIFPAALRLAGLRWWGYSRRRSAAGSAHG